MSTLKVGDVVHLNSGSARMTVTNITGGSVSVAWVHFESQQMYTATLHSDCFEKDKSHGSAE